MEMRATIYYCDDPACTVERMGSATEDPIGLRGTVEEAALGGGVGRLKWFACSREHVGAAIAGAIDETRRLR